jgi:hypothetical protein
MSVLLQNHQPDSTEILTSPFLVFASAFCFSFVSHVNDLHDALLLTIAANSHQFLRHAGVQAEG